MDEEKKALHVGLTGAKEADLILEQLIEAKKNKNRKAIKEEREILERRLERLKTREKLDNNFYERSYRSLLLRLDHLRPKNLYYWMMFDTWDIYSGIAILNNIDPRSLCFDDEGYIYKNEVLKDKKQKTPSTFCPKSFIHLHLVTLDGIELSNEELNHILGVVNAKTLSPKSTEQWQRNLLKNYYTALAIWQSGNHNEGRYPPQYFIEWAVSKNMAPKWLDWAKENNLIGGSKKSTNDEKEINAKSESAYLNIIGALFGELLSEKRKTNPKITQTSLIEDLSIAYDGYSGLSKTNLGQKVPSAIRRINKPS